MTNLKQTEPTLGQQVSFRRPRRIERLRRALFPNPRAIAGIVGLAFLVGLAVVGPTVWSVDPVSVSRDVLASPSLEHPFGTDDVGRDVLALILRGARVSLVVGLAAATASLAVGVVVGSIAGYFGKRIDTALMRVAEFFQVIPTLLLALVIVAILGSSLTLVVFAIAVSMWPVTARLVRGEFLSIREREFVQSAFGLGFSHWSIISRHILPNAVSPAIVQVSLHVGQAVLIEAALSFLGLSDPNVQSWGALLQRAQSYLSTAWWLSVFPGLAICVFVIAANLLGDGLNQSRNAATEAR